MIWQQQDEKQENVYGVAGNDGVKPIVQSSLNKKVW